MAADSRNALDSRTLAEALAKDTGVPLKKVLQLLTGLASKSAAALKEGKSVHITGLGVLLARERPAAAGSADAATKHIVLAPAKQLKAAVGK